jgi:RimJ/RimL family protein N-acetyltransferase
MLLGEPRARARTRGRDARRPPEKDIICETAQAVVRVPDFNALRDIFRLGRDPDARRFFFHLEALPASRVAGLIRHHRKQQERNGLSCWPAYRKADGAFVFELRHSEFAGGIGFTAAVMPAYRGTPLVKEICRAVLGYGFSRGGFERIVALVEPDNLAAQKFLTKLGFRHLQDVPAPNEVTLKLYEVRRDSLQRD